MNALASIDRIEAQWNLVRWALLSAAGAMIVSALVLPPVYALGFFVAVLVTAVVMRFPIAGFCLLAFAVPWAGGAGAPLGSLPITPADALVALLTGVWIARSSELRQNPITTLVWVPYLLLFIAAITLSATQATNLYSAVREIVKWLELVLVFLAGTALLSSRKDVHLIVASLVAAAVSQALLGYTQLGLGLGPMAFIQHQFLRAYGSFDQPNPYAGYLNMVFPLALAVALFIRDRRLATAYGAAAIFILGAILASESRGALLATVLVIAVLFSTRWEWARRFTALGIVFVLLGALGATFGLIPLGPFQRILDAVGLGGVTFGHVTDANFSAVERAAHWLAGVRMFAAHPVLGVGIGNYADAYPAYHPRGWYAPLAHAHNYYINIAAEAGIAGLASYLLVVGSALWYSYASFRRSHDPLFRAAALGVLGALIATSFHNLFDVLYVHGTVALLGVLMALVGFCLTPRDSDSLQQEAPIPIAMRYQDS